jgi:fructose-1,6-bisphosphatase/inositol monophosphatase family enzyme/glycerophosphoryl diester phosphodiesterase
VENETYQTAIDWVLEAGEIIKKRMQGSIDVKHKTNHSDLVTAVDREIETYFVNKIMENYPLHNILGEENVGNQVSDSTYLWIIDPIDGTSNFINRKKDFAISVAFCKHNQGVFGIVYDVMAGKLYRAQKGSGAFLNDTKLDSINKSSLLEDELVAINTPWKGMEEMKQWQPLYKLATQVRGVRVYGATTIELCEMATGTLGGFAQYFVNAWDFAASRIVLEEIGGKFSDLDGNDIDMIYKGGVAAASICIHKQIIQSLSGKSFEQIYSDYIDPNGRVLTVAHRGNWKQAPENSLKAIQYSMNSGIDMIEIDVQKTKDGKLVLIHDDTVDRMTNGSGKITDLTFEEVRALRLKQGQGGESSPITSEVIPTLEEILLLIKNKVMVNLDKCWQIREEVYQILVNTGTVRQALFKSSAEIDEVEEFITNKTECPEYMQIIDESNQHLLDQLDQILTRIKPKAFELSFLQDDNNIISAETLQHLKGKCRIWTNTMWDSLCGGHTDEVSLTNPHMGWDWHISRGVNMIQTDYPQELCDYFNKQ